MARPKKAAPDLYWLASRGCWCVTFPGGKRHYLGPDRAAAEVRRAELLLEREREREQGLTVQAMLSLPDARRTVADVLALYRASLRPSMSASYIRRIDRAVGLLKASDLGRLPAAKLNPLHVEALRRELAGKPHGPDGEGLARNTINGIVRAIQTAWRWAVSRVIVSGPHAQAILGLRALEAGDGGREVSPRLPVDDATVDATLPHLPTLVADAVRLLRVTGMRPGELCAMRRRDVSTRATEQVEPLPGWRIAAPIVGADGNGDSCMTVWLYAPPRHKTRRKGKARVVALGPVAQAILAPWLDGLDDDAVVFSPRRSEEVRSRERREARECPVYASQEEQRARDRPIRRGRPPRDQYTADTLAKVVLRACRAAGVQPWTLYQLRHGVAVSVADVHGDEIAGEVLGHATGSGVTGRYTRTKLARVAEVAARVG